MPPPRVIVFGACDRHNLGDLLFPHVVAAGLPGRDVVVAGLVARDLRSVGGHAVQALAGLGDGEGDTLIHAGGELLTCTAWQAAVMLLPPDEVQPTLAFLRRRPAGRRAFVRARLGTDARAPYVVSRARMPRLGRVVHAGVGGVDLDRADPALREEVLAALRTADAVAVRDGRTQAHLAAAGVASALLPDPVALLVERFGDVIRRRCAAEPLAALRAAGAAGHLAVQCSAEFGDDATLSALAAPLGAWAAGHGLGVALFRAGAAPWHDDLDVLRRLAARLAVHLPAGRVQVVESLEIWTLCALIAASRGYVGSSLHGRIVAAACGRPHLNLRPPTAEGRPGKVAAYADTWERARLAAGVPAEVDVHDLAPALDAAMTLDPALLQAQSAAMAAVCRAGLAALCREGV